MPAVRSNESNAAGRADRGSGLSLRDAPMEYDPRVGDPLIWEIAPTDLVALFDEYPEASAFAVAETWGVPFVTFWDWSSVVAFVAGKQIIERKGRPVWYTSPEGGQFAFEQFLEGETDEIDIGVYAQLMPHFHDQFIPPWFQRFVPRVQHPGSPRHNPSRPGPRRPAVSRRAPATRLRSRIQPRPNPYHHAVPGGVYYAAELAPLFREPWVGPGENRRIAIDYDGHPLAIFGGFDRRFSDQGGHGSSFDPDLLWEDACLFIAAHQLFMRNVRPVWIGKLQWEDYPPEPPAEMVEAVEEWEALHESGELTLPIGELPPFEYSAFHVTYYPYEIGAALELPAPPPPPGQLPPPEPTILAERAAREARHRGEMVAAARLGAFGPEAAAHAQQIATTFGALPPRP